jgi:hypothetical protein
MKAGTVVIIKADYEWKYGEPSYYRDEQIWYLVMKADGELLEPDDEDFILSQMNKTYANLLMEANRVEQIRYVIQ